VRLIQIGPRNAKIVAVGEAPGRKEAQTGIPFVGGSGDLLNRVLNNVELLRDDIFITNVCHEQPPGNQFGWFLKPKIRPQFLQGVIQLKTDLEAIKPNVVVAFGAQALRVLTGKAQIAKWRGSILESNLVKGLKVIGTWHPAFVLRDNYDYKAIIEFDMARVKEESLTPEINLPQREILIDPSSAVKHKVAAEMAASEWLSIDIECFDTNEGWRLACVGFSHRPDCALVLPCDSKENMLMIGMLCGGPARKIFQNGFNFDIPVLLQHNIRVTNYGWDTMCGMHALYPECASSEEETQILTGKKKLRQPALRKGLAFQTSIFTKEPYYKDDGKLWHETGDLEQFWLYNGKDAAVTREIQLRQEEDLKEIGAESVLKHEMAMTGALMAMTARGIPIDKKVHLELKEKYTEEIINLQNFLDAGAGTPINVKSNPNIAWLLFEKLGLPVIKRSEKTKKPSADKDVLNTLAEKYNNPLLQTILEIRERRDLIERYLDVAYDDDGRMRCAWDPTGTRTGRLASRVSIHGTGTNLQNQPPALRRMFIPDPGKVMWSIDYSQAEARVVAWLARCESLIELFNDPTRDVHKENAARFYDIPVEVVTFLQRYVAKRTVHASNYGMEWFTFWRTVNNDYRDTGIRITQREARRGQEMYFGMYPEIKSVFWKEVQDELRHSLKLVSALGRPRIFYGRWSDKFLNEAYSYNPQSTVGDLTNMAMVKVHEQVPETELFVNGHDSLIGQCFLKDLYEVTSKVQELMRIPLTIHGRELIIPTDVEVGYNWGKATDDNPRGLMSIEDWKKAA